MIRKFVTLLLVLSFVTPLFYTPYQAQRAEAFLGIGDIVIDVKALLDRIFSGIAQQLAQRMIDDMVKSTVKWAQTGFDGNPAYAVNPKQYFTDIADGVVGDFVRTDGALGYLCSPFQANIRLSLVQEYSEPEPFQCTLTDVIGNIENYYEDFSQGGWDAWFSMTQNPTNNPYGAYLAAKIELDSRIASAVGLEEQQLDWNMGFLSQTECLGTEVQNNVTGKTECVGATRTVTPGSTIKSGLDKVLPSGLEKLISAQHMDQLVSAFAGGLLTRYVFGPKGLFAGGGGGSSSGVPDPGTSQIDARMARIDLDNDGVPDGQDADRDGRLISSVDVCYHGGNPPNCSLSASTTNSPYFAAVCVSITRATFALSEYAKFMDTNAGQIKNGESMVGQIFGGFQGGLTGGYLGGFLPLGGGTPEDFKNKADADIWAYRTSEVSSAIDEILNVTQTYRAPYFDNLEITANRFSNYLGKVLESLIKDGDLDLAKFGNGGGGLNNLARHTANNARYLNEVKTRMGQCEKPNVSNINSIQTPPIVEPPEGGGQCLLTGNKYESVLAGAMSAVLAENPSVAALDPRVNEPRNGREYRVNAVEFLRLTAEKLESMGYRATEEVLNGNNLPSTGDGIAVWLPEDTEMERYDAIDGKATVMRNAPMTDFTGFIPLNCTLSGGGNDCGCKTTDGGGDDGGEGGNNPGTPGTPGGPRISSVSPNTVAPGATITITGTNLSSTVRFVSSAGPETVGGASVNSAKTQVTVQVPSTITAGSATVQNIVYNNSSVVSNTFPITIRSTSGGNVTLATPTSTLTPTGIDRVGYNERIYPNGWWPSISPDGKYVAFGNWGDSFVLDLESGSTAPQWNFTKPAGLPDGVRCMAGQWLSSTKLTFICEISETSMWRYEVNVGEWIARKTDDSPQNVLSTMFRAKDGHWASYAAPNTRSGTPSRIVKNNQVIASNSGGAISMAGNTVVHACTNNNNSICVRTGSTLSRSHTTHAGFHSTATDGSYILYGGYEAGVRGITPTGSMVNLTLSPSGLEGPSEIIMVNGTRWVISMAWGDDYSYIILRPWGSRSAIVVNAPATWTSTVYKNGNFVIAYNNDVGAIKVITVSANAPRHQF